MSIPDGGMSPLCADRRGISMQRTLLVSLAGGLAALTLISLTSFLYNRPTVLRVAVARESEDARLLAGIQQAFAKDGKDIRLKINPVADAVESAAALESGKADLAVVRSDIAMPPSGQTLVILHRNAAVLMATAAAKIDKIGGLRGHKVGVLRAVATGQGNLNLLDTVLAQYDVPPESVEKIPLTLAELPQAIRTGAIDALLTVGIPGAGGAGDAVGAFTQNSEGPPTFIAISEAGALSQRSPAYEAVEVLAGSFGGSPPRPARTFNTLGVTSRLVAHNKMSEATAADLTRYLFAERPVVAQTVPLANRMEAPAAEKGQTFPVHPGTLAYLDGEEQTFLEKNSDYIYLGAMMLSVLGSAAAAFASRMGAQGHAQLEGHLENLLNLMTAAREAPDADTLDEIEAEAGRVLIAALSKGTVRGLDGHRASAFTLALDHLRASIAVRRREMAGRVPGRLALAGE